MKIVIEISDTDCQLMNDGHVPFSILDKMRNGTPLPKEHGRLIDADDVYNALRPYVSFSDLYDVLDEIPTIIEADGGGEE